MSAKPKTARARAMQRKRQRERLQADVRVDRELLRQLTIATARLHKATDRYTPEAGRKHGELLEAREISRKAVHDALARLKPRPSAER